MNLNFEMYRTFCKVAENKSITKAADELYVSQSAVTQYIQKLETILGEKLFFRNKGGVELTDLGKNLYDHIEGSIKVLENTEELFANYSNLNKGVLRIGGGNTLITNLLLNPLCEFSKKYPNIRVTFTNGRSEWLVEGVANGEIDITTLNMPYIGKKYSNIEIIPMKNSSYCLFASNEYYEKNKLKNIKNLEDIAKHRLIVPFRTSMRYKIFEETMKGHKIDIDKCFEASSSVIVKKLVLTDLGIGFCEIDSLKDIKDKVKIIKEFKFGEQTQGVVVLQKNSQSKATKEFLKILKETYEGK